MDLISSIFPCIQRRKPLKCSGQEQNAAQPESEESKASSAASRTVPCKSSARMSVRIVEAVDSQTTIALKSPVMTMTGSRRTRTRNRDLLSHPSSAKTQTQTLPKTPMSESSTWISAIPRQRKTVTTKIKKNHRFPPSPRKLQSSPRSKAA